MKFQYICDLHLEYGKYQKFPEIPVKAEVLVIGGDIGYPISRKPQLEQFLSLQSKRFKTIIFSPGCVEFYLMEYHKQKTELKKLCEKFENVHLIYDSSYLFKKEKIRFIGCMLWTYSPEDEKIPEGTPDHEKENFFNRRQIYPLGCSRWHDIFYLPPGEKDPYNWREMNMDDTNKLREVNLKFIKDGIDIAKKNGEKIVMVTFFPPTFKDTIDPEILKENEKVKLIHASNTENLIVEPIKVWCYSHTHYKQDQKINDVRLVTNPLGYYFEDEIKKKFDPELVIEV